MPESTDSQKYRILAYLETGRSLTTIEARERLGVLHPAARVQNLRDSGVDIKTIWTVDVTEQGSAHRVARYLLNRDENQRKETA